MDNRLRLAFLGPLGTYTHQAAARRFADEVEYIAKETIRATFEALENEASISVIPYENSTHGAVVETLDILQSMRFPESVFVSEIIELEVNHCLVVRRGTRVEEVRHIYSHEQALGQCSRFIGERFQHAMLHKTPSTAAAAEKVAGDEEYCRAAICSVMCIQLFKELEIKREAIQNDQNNFTRFLVVTTSYKTVTPCTTSQTIKDGFCFRWAALVRLRYGCESDLSTVLGALGLSVQKIDRRACVPHEKFQDDYFAEVFDKGFRGCEDEWRRRIERGLLRVRQTGAIACLLGYYRLL